MTNEELRTVLTYCWLLSRLVSPRTARPASLFRFDSGVRDFLNDLSVCRDIANFNIENDEFYSEVFRNMQTDLIERGTLHRG